MAQATLNQTNLTFDGDSDVNAKLTASANAFVFSGAGGSAKVLLDNLASDPAKGDSAATVAYVGTKAAELIASQEGSALAARTAIANAAAATAASNATIAANATAAVNTKADDNAAAITAEETARQQAIANEASQRAADIEALKAGLHWKQAVKARNNGNLNGIYNNSTNLTIGGPAGALPAIDGVSLSQGDRLLLADQTEDKENGIYVVTTVGVTDANDASNNVPFLLTRSSDFDSNADFAAAAVFVQAGAVYQDKSYVLTSDTATLGDALVFSDFTQPLANGEVTTAKLGPDAVTGAKVADSAIDSEHIAAGAIDDGHCNFNALSCTSVAAQSAIYQQSVQAQSFIATSDKRLKNSFSHVDNATEMINRIPTYSYKFNGSDNIRYGTTAQDLLEYPDLATFVHKNEDDSLAVNYTDIVPLLCQALNEQAEQVKELRAQVFPMV